MPTIRPIPKRLLIHSVSYKEFVGGNGWSGVNDYAEPVEIKNVRVEPTTSLKRTNNQEQIEGNFVLFLDRVHTTPFIKMIERSKVVLNGDELEVHKVKPLYGFSPDPHHYEVELV